MGWASDQVQDMPQGRGQGTAEEALQHRGWQGALTSTSAKSTSKTGCQREAKCLQTQALPRGSSVCRGTPAEVPFMGCPQGPRRPKDHRYLDIMRVHP